MIRNAKVMLIVAVLSLLYGGGMIILLAHALDRQQTVMQEGY